MILLVLLFLASVAGLVAALVQPGWADLVLVAGPSALASLILLIRAVALMARRQDGSSDHDPARSSAPRRPLSRAATPRDRHILVDGSNVMHWKDGTPQLDTLRVVLARLTALGFNPGVVFDANAGYKIADSYRDDADLGRMLGLHKDRVLVMPRGTPADPTLLAAARDLDARIVTNDRFRDWAETYPEVARPGHLVRGGFSDGQLWLDLEGAVPDRGQTLTPP